MQISYKWLERYVDLEGITSEQIAQKLTAAAYEVEEVRSLGAGMEKVVVGEVLSKTKHPDADKLSVLKVKISETETPLEIVCGAPNVAVGQKVAVALVGAELPCGLLIAERKVRGIKSNGMVCAEDELGLGKDHAGIMVLDKDLSIGTPLAQALGLDDTIFSIDVLPNRAHDSLCHYGVAREVATLFDLTLKELPAPEFAKADNGAELKVEIQDTERCPRYAAALLKDVKITESPQAIQQLLRAVGLRPINNLVDITNFLMFSFGSPLHAFDADKLQGKIVVRLARAGEKILALDGETYELNEDDLVICDEAKPIAIAGVMGGLETAVSDATRRVIFEAANFSPDGIRKTAQRLKISSDAAYRFERGVDPNLAGLALREAIELTETWAGAKMANEIVDHYPAPTAPRTLSFDLKKVKNLLGLEISQTEIQADLKKLGFGVKVQDEKMQVEIPTWRLDVAGINDVIEEIARINGYEKIAPTPALVEMRRQAQSPAWNFLRENKTKLVGLGFMEVYNTSFVSEEEIADLGRQIKPLALKNYLSEEEKFFRTSLVSKLLKNVSENAKYSSTVNLFEIGKVVEMSAEGEIVEKRKLGIITYLKNSSERFSVGKGKLAMFLEIINVPAPQFSPAVEPAAFWHNGRTAEIKSGEISLGQAGEIHPRLLEKYEIPGRVFCADLDFEALLKVAFKTETYEPINRFPSSEFDLAVIIASETSWAEIYQAIEDLKIDHLVGVEPFDVYRGEEIVADKKSVAFKVICQAEDRTLTDREVKKVMDRIIKALEKLGGEIRQ